MITAVALKTIAKPVIRSVDVSPTTSYRTIGVKWWGEGAYERETIDGLQTAAKTLSIVKENDLIINKIWVRHGSIAIAGKNVDGCAASGEFPTFEIDLNQVLPLWLHWYTKTKEFWDKCSELSQGTSGKNRIKPDLFLTVEIPLPPLEEQRRIVGRIEELAGKIAEARGLRERSIEEAEVLKTRIYEIGWSQAVSYSDNWENLERYANVIDPQPDHRTPPEIDGGMPYVSIANISIAGKVDIIGARKVSITAIERQEASFTLKTGDIVLGKIGTIGAARPIIVKDRFALSANVVLVQPDESKVMKEFILGLLRSPQMKEQFTEGTRKTAQEAFGIKKMRKLLIPVPPLPEQQRIVTYLDALQSNVDTAKRLRQESLKELDALLPAILDKAFKGEL